jgi:lipopolysaccharide/colanic/teichoic acid biosynthesis glycosyltransferase
MYPVAKRLLDVLGASLLLLLLSPLLAVVALAIWGVDGRPVFFTQVRAGRGGAPFQVYKFRTLEPGPKDPTRPAAHTTRLGGPLRRWAIDELPQLWNVLRGEMSLVGPRPVPLSQAERYGPRERRRLRVRPGITGWAQVQGRNALSWPERIEHDRWYVRHRSLWIDLRILGRTPLILLRGTGVYGPDGRTPSFSSPPDPNA